MTGEELDHRRKAIGTVEEDARIHTPEGASDLLRINLVKGKLELKKGRV